MKFGHSRALLKMSELSKYLMRIPFCRVVNRFTHLVSLQSSLELQRTEGLSSIQKVVRDWSKAYIVSSLFICMNVGVDEPDSTIGIIPSRSNFLPILIFHLVDIEGRKYSRIEQPNLSIVLFSKVARHIEIDTYRRTGEISPDANPKDEE